MNYAPQPDQTHEEPSTATPAHAKEERELSTQQRAVLVKVSDLGPGHVDLIVQALQQHPELHDLIIQEATRSAGNEAVARALQELSRAKNGAGKLAKGKQMTGTKAFEGDSEFGLRKEEGISDGPAMTGTKAFEGDSEFGLRKEEGISDGPAMRGTKAFEGDSEFGLRKEEGISDGPPMTGTSVLEEMELDGKQKFEAMKKARAYNNRHSGLVAEFNQLTSNNCVGSDGEVDPYLVARWQQEYGVEPDGRVGPKTVAAAREGSPGRPTETAQAAPADDAREARPEADRPRGLDMI